MNTRLSFLKQLFSLELKISKALITAKPEKGKKNQSWRFTYKDFSFHFKIFLYHRSNEIHNYHPSFNSSKGIFVNICKKRYSVYKLQKKEQPSITLCSGFVFIDSIEFLIQYWKRRNPRLQTKALIFILFIPSKSLLKHYIIVRANKDKSLSKIKAYLMENTIRIILSTWVKVSRTSKS